jgi:hypothetical protein
MSGGRFRVRASSANPWDWHFIRGEPYQGDDPAGPRGAAGTVLPEQPMKGSGTTVNP